ncbi:MAG: Uncharacterised protein [Synechococcus sp. CC9902]|nr:MAG: Uncharacterised protein [Synechococcus sp. CC9902]
MVNPSHFQVPKAGLMQRLDLTEQHRKTRALRKIGGVGSDDDQEWLAVQGGDQRLLSDQPLR